MVREISPIHRPPPGGEYYVFRDQVHNLIEIESESDGKYVRDLLRTRELQRLRHIRQNGFSSLVYQSLETSRFPHSLGTFHIARRVASSLFERQPGPSEGFPESLKLTPRDCLAFSVAALVHDIGHGPLSHVWEECWAKPRGQTDFHEVMGLKILTNPATGIGARLAAHEAHRDYVDLGKDIIAFVERKHRLSYLFPLLAGNLDVDRLDFMARDTRSAGVSYGFHDLEWIIRSLRFARLPEHHTGGSGAQWIIAIDGRKGLSTLVQFLHARENMYRLVYYHKTTRAASKMLGLLFNRASILAKAGKLECPMPMMQRALEGDSIDVETYLRLDDSDVWSSLKYWADGKNCDPVLADLSRRILERDLFKVFMLSDEVYKRLLEIDSEACGYNLREMVEARVGCSKEDAGYYYAFDATRFDVIGRPPKSPLYDVWIMNSVPTGFDFMTLRTYWKNEIRAPTDHEQHLLIVHPDVVQDLANVVERLSFPASSEKTVPDLPKAPDPYQVIAPLGAEGAWKEVYVGVHCNPGRASKNIVALKRYKSTEDGSVAIDRDVKALNLLIAERHPNLQHAEVLSDNPDEIWLIEELWTSSLEDLIKKQGPQRNLIEIFEIAEQLFSGITALHRANLRHTDIKPDNCGIMKTGLEKPRYILGDFGCISSVPDQMPEDRRLLGTLRTRAPEVTKGELISLKSDVWSMGATVYAICTKKYPFMEFEAPHHDAEDRRRRELEIRANLDELQKRFLSDISEALPPQLSTRLQPCFEVEQERATAALVWESFHDAASDLRTGGQDNSATAWQRAQDIFSAFTGLKSVKIYDSVMSDISELIEKHQDFIPPKLIRSLQEILKERAG